MDTNPMSDYFKLIGLGILIIIAVLFIVGMFIGKFACS